MSIERGVVRQIVDDLKPRHSAKTMAIGDELLEVLTHWRQPTQFSVPKHGIITGQVF